MSNEIIHIQQKDLKNIGQSKMLKELVIKYDDDKEVYFVYCRLIHPTEFDFATIPIFSQKGEPKNFKMVERAIDWGSKQGFASVKLYRHYTDPNSELIHDDV